MKTSLLSVILFFFSVAAYGQISIASVTANPASCSNNGSATITITGGSPVFCYRINGGPCQYSGSRTYTFTGLYSGNYTITVEDGQSTVSESVTVGGNYTEPTAWATVNGCSVLANATGGLPPYMYAISINGGPFSAPGSDPNFNNVNGNYCIRVYDACNNFTQYCGNLAIAPLQMQAACCGGSGQMCVNITDMAGNPTNSPSFWIGGLPPYTFSASSDGQTVTSPDGNFNLDPACPGWTFTVTDACGSTVSASADCLTAEVLCINCTAGTAEIAGMFGTPPFTYEYQDPSGAWLPNPGGANSGSFSGLPTFPTGGGYTFSFRVKDACGNTSEIVTGTCLDAPATFDCSRGEAYINPTTDFYPVTVVCSTCTPVSTQTLQQGDAAFFENLSGNDEFVVTDDCGAEIIKKCEEVDSEVSIQRSCNALKASLQSMYACDGNNPLPINVETGVTYTLYLASDPSRVLATNSTGEFGGLTPGETYIVEAIHAICGMASERTTLFNYGDFIIEYFVEPTSFVQNGVCVSGYNIAQNLKPEPDLPPEFQLSGGTFFESPMPNDFDKLTPDIWLLEATNYCVETNVNLPEWEPDITVEMPECPSNGGCITMTGMRTQQNWLDFGASNGLTIYIGSDYYTLNCPDLQQATNGCEGSWTNEFCNLVPGQVNTLYLRPAVGECPVDTTEFVLDLGGTAKLDSVDLTTGVACAVDGFADLQVEVFGGKDPLYLEVLDNNTAQILQTIPDSDGDHIIDIPNLQAGREYLFRIVDDCGNTTDALANVIALPDVVIEYDFNCPGSLTLFTDVIYGAEYTWLRADGSVIEKDVNLFSIDLPASTQPEQYSVMINFSSCPTHTTTIDVPGFPLPIVDFTFDDTIICSASPFILEPIVSAGNLSYEWSNGATTPTLTITQSDDYKLTVTDLDNGCVSVDSVSISLSPPIFISFDKSDLDCYGDADGTAEVTPNGGQAPYIFEWETGGSTDAISNLVAGFYTVTITDKENCRVVDSIEIIQPNQLQITGQTTDATCGDIQNGAITTNVIGGVGNYDYNWDNGSTTPDLNNLSAGEYVLEIKDENGCAAIEKFEVSTPDSLLAELEVFDVKCNGLATGSIVANVSGGTAPLTYQWSDGQTTQDAQNLIAGPYTLEITDGKDCKFTLSETITEPPVLDGRIDKEDVTCFDFNNGKIEVFENGGVAPYRTTSTPDIGNGEDLAPANYQITITDANDCIFELSETITQPNELQISGQATNATCGTLENGKIETTVTGGTGNYQYSWDNGMSAPDLNDISAGQYILEVKDENDCITTETFDVFTPDSLLAELDVFDVKCNGLASGSLATTISGGTAPFSYQWSDGQTTQNASNLTAGQYTLEITDANDCPFVLTETISEPSLLEGSTTKEDVTCFNFDNGKINVLGSGGVAPYRITSMPDIGNGEDLAAGNYEITVTDENGCIFKLSETIEQPDSLELQVDWNDVKCNGDDSGSALATSKGGTFPYRYAWSNGETSPQIVKVGAGIYTVTTMDANDCETNGSIDIAEPAAFVGSFQADEIQCFGETAAVQINAAGGVTPYTGIGTQQLSVGTHEFIIEDENNCLDTVSLTMTQPDELLIENILVTDAGCDGDAFGEISTQPVGGTLPYNFNWDNGRVTSTIQNLPAGTYTIEVTDDNDCQTETEIEVTDLPPLEVDLSQDDVSCFGFSDGSIVLEDIVGGAGAPYYLDGQTEVNPGFELDDLIAGIYDHTITDPDGCESEIQIEITEPPLFFIEVPEQLQLKLGDDLNINPQVNGQPADPINWSWTPVNQLNCPTCPELNIRPFYTSTYYVTAVDANGCVSKDTLSLTLDRNCELFMPDAFSPNLDGTNDVIFPFAPPCVEKIQRLSIFDRWGQQLYVEEDFAPNDAAYSWDGDFRGQKMQSGVYVWFAEVLLIDGREVLFKGDLTVVR